MFGKKSGSTDTKDFIKVSGKSILSDCLDHIWNNLDTSLSNDLGIWHAVIPWFKLLLGGIPSFTINDGIRFSKLLTGQQLSTEKRFCNCCRTVSIKGMPIRNKEEVYQQLRSTYYTEPLEPLAFPLHYLYMKSAAFLRCTISGILDQCHPSNIESLIWYCQSLCMSQIRQYIFFVV